MDRGDKEDTIRGTRSITWIIGQSKSFTDNSTMFTEQSVIIPNYQKV